MPTMANQLQDALLRRKEVEAHTKLGRSTLYSKLNPKDRGYDPSFPIPVRISTGGGIRWLQSEIEAWIASRPRTRHVAGKGDE
jgi:prophage regulatory protein